MRNIEKIISPTSFTWVGDAFYTTSFIGGEIPRHRMDPFFAFGYNPDKAFSGASTPRGVGAHPHKGFETVTLAYKGQVEHRDSRGNHGIISEGDVQWMTAGAGIMHQEYHETEWAKKGGVFQMVQMWVNLPAKDKETTPGYQSLMSQNMPKVPVKNGSVQIVAGEYQGQQGPGSTFSPMHVYNVHLEEGGNAAFSLPLHYNTAFLVLDGKVKVGNQRVEKDQFALMANENDPEFNIEALEANTKVLLISGEPLNEPVAHYGPFVMNTPQQLEEAFREFREGKFGEI
jgi:redox-sensitive bicupin YhaK (pirin superfamily)